MMKGLIELASRARAVDSFVAIMGEEASEVLAVRQERAFRRADPMPECQPFVFGESISMLMLTHIAIRAVTDNMVIGAIFPSTV